MTAQFIANNIFGNKYTLVDISMSFCRRYPFSFVLQGGVTMEFRRRCWLGLASLAPQCANFPNDWVSQVFVRNIKQKISEFRFSAIPSMWTWPLSASPCSTSFIYEICSQMRQFHRTLEQKCLNSCFWRLASCWRETCVTRHGRLAINTELGSNHSISLRSRNKNIRIRAFPRPAPNRHGPYVGGRGRFPYMARKLWPETP